MSPKRLSSTTRMRSISPHRLPSARRLLLCLDLRLGDLEHGSGRFLHRLEEHRDDLRARAARLDLTRALPDLNSSFRREQLRNPVARSGARSPFSVVPFGQGKAETTFAGRVHSWPRGRVEVTSCGNRGVADPVGRKRGLRTCRFSRVRQRMGGGSSTTRVGSGRRHPTEAARQFSVIAASDDDGARRAAGLSPRARG